MIAAAPLPRVSSESSLAASETAPRSACRKLVAIAVPLSARATLSADEQISLRHLDHYLGSYDRFVVRPRSNPHCPAGFGQKVFNDRYFGSASAYTRLMLSRQFYQAFSDYEYVLIYHLDALTLSDQLTSWCQLGFDFIGAPWLRSPNEPQQGFAGVGNGGFSLRRVSSMLKVIHSSQRATEPREYWNKYYASKPAYSRLLNLPRWWLKHLRLLNNVRREMAQVNYNEDYFWSLRARHFHDGFRIAPVEVALRFAFESAPRYCFEQNQRQLPFGCHAWDRYDRAFWEPFLLQ